MTVKVRNLGSLRLPVLRYLVICNVLHICNVRAIPTHRVYRLYDETITVIDAFYTQVINNTERRKLCQASSQGIHKISDCHS